MIDDGRPGRHFDFWISLHDSPHTSLFRIEWWLIYFILIGFHFTSWFSHYSFHASRAYYHIAMLDDSAYCRVPLSQLPYYGHTRYSHKYCWFSLSSHRKAFSFETAFDFSISVTLLIVYIYRLFSRRFIGDSKVLSKRYIYYWFSLDISLANGLGHFENIIEVLPSYSPPILYEDILPHFFIISISFSLFQQYYISRSHITQCLSRLKERATYIFNDFCILSSKGPLTF